MKRSIKHNKKQKTGGVRSRSKNVQSRNHIVSSGKRGKRKFDSPKPGLVRPLLTKPRFKKHVCENESNCKECKIYIQKLDDWWRKKK